MIFCSTTKALVKHVQSTTDCCHAVCLWPLGSITMLGLFSLWMLVASTTSWSQALMSASQHMHPHARVCMQMNGMSRNDVRPCNLGSSSGGPQSSSFYLFDMGYACGWDLAEGTMLPTHGLFSSYEMLLAGCPKPFSDFQSLLFSALHISGCKLPWKEAARRRGDFAAMTLRYDLLESPEGSSVLAPWPAHLRHFAIQVFRAAVLPFEQQRQSVSDVGLWLYELRSAAADSPSRSGAMTFSPG